MPNFSSLLVSGSQSNASLCGNCWKGRKQRCQIWALMERIENWAVCKSSSEKPAGTKLALALHWKHDCLPECPLAINIKSNSIKSSVKNSDLPWRAAGGQPATPQSPWWHRSLGTYQSTNQPTQDCTAAQHSYLCESETPVNGCLWTKYNGICIYSSRWLETTRLLEEDNLTAGRLAGSVSLSHCCSRWSLKRQCLKFSNEQTACQMPQKNQMTETGTDESV